MWYEIAATVTALVHLAFLLFVVFGAILGRRSLGWRVAHVVVMIYGVSIEVFYWYCPLTYLEQYLRRASGGSSYEEPFIVHYLNQIIYLEVPQWSLILAAVVVLAVNAAIYVRWSHKSSRTAQAR
jgi:hypothetical protein